jgi:hypothetical protein
MTTPLDPGYGVEPFRLLCLECPGADVYPPRHRQQGNVLCLSPVAMAPSRINSEYGRRIDALDNQGTLL